MISTILAHLRAQWMGALALFLVLAGGTAYAANTIASSDIINGEVKSVDVGNNQVRSVDVTNEGLTGADIEDQSGVDNCTHSTVRFGELCAENDDVSRDWTGALTHCAASGLRLPTFGEAEYLALNHDVPSVGAGEYFWTDETSVVNGVNYAWIVDEDGGWTQARMDVGQADAVCVTTPTN